MAKDFPASDWLGYGLDMTTATPLDIQSVMAAVKKAHRILDYDPYSNTRIVTIGGIEYEVPKYIGVSDYNVSNGDYVTYRTGSDASSSFEVDAKLSARYLAVSAGASTSYALEKSLKKEDQFAFYSFNAETYLASLRDYSKLLIHELLKERLDDMPKFDGENEHSLTEWKDFFAYYGSHVILNASYGARFQLTVWASNEDTSVNKSFSASVNAAFDGIAFGGKFDASVKKQTQYKTFSNYMQKTVSVIGGDPELNKSLTADPSHNDRFVEWAQSVARESSLGSFTLMEIWILMRNSKELKHHAGMVKEAYEYIVGHPKPYQTAILFDIQSDWAEFNLLSPSATIIANPEFPWPSYTVASQTRVSWGKGHGNQQKLQFFVINDGSPIDFSISHGSDGTSRGNGRAEIFMAGQNYLSKGVTDNVWNTTWFYQKRVSPKPVVRNEKRSTLPRSWNDVLNEYLGEIGARVPKVVDA